MSGWVNFNGSLLPQETALITAGSRAFRYGDGLFETMRTAGENILLKALHFERLSEGMKVLQLQLTDDVTTDVLEQQVFRTIAKNNITGEARVRLSVFRGEGNLYETGRKGSGYIIQAWPLAPRHTMNEDGLVIGIYNGAKKSCDMLANIKSNNFLVYVLAALHCTNNRWDDCLVLNSRDRICDATIANVFWIKENKIFTTPLSEGCVAGVMRKHLLGVLPSRGFDIKEKPVAIADLEDADELFLTNAISGMRWVKKLNGRTFGNRICTEVYRSTF